MQNESEILPFPNKETDFALPDVDYRDLLHKCFPRSPTKLDESKSEQKTEKEPHSELPVLKANHSLMQKYNCIMGKKFIFDVHS